MTETKKYWLKLNKDFLKSPQMKVIRSLPNGKDYIIFYLSLMLESIETVGHLRFTSLVPYNAEMLSAVTETNIDIVRSATKIFCELGLMQIFDDGTIFMSYVPEMTGKECESAERVRNYRQKQKMLQCNAVVTKSNDNKDKDKDKKEEKEKNNIKLDFETFYKSYPRKIGKKKAFTSYSNVIKDGVTHEQIMNGLKKYVDYINQNKTEERFIAHPTTWLNQGRWDDVLDNKKQEKEDYFKKAREEYNRQVAEQLERERIEQEEAQRIEEEYNERFGE